jgi:hypothetical protein
MYFKDMGFIIKATIAPSAKPRVITKRTKQQANIVPTSIHTARLVPYTVAVLSAKSFGIAAAVIPKQKTAAIKPPSKNAANRGNLDPKKIKMDPSIIALNYVSVE